MGVLSKPCGDTPRRGDFKLRRPPRGGPIAHSMSARGLLACAERERGERGPWGPGVGFGNGSAGPRPRLGLGCEGLGLVMDG